jgi:hypothetical protein
MNRAAHIDWLTISRSGDTFVLEDSNHHSTVLSLPLCCGVWAYLITLVPIAPGARIFVSGIWPCCSRKFVTFSARSVLSF